MMNEMMNEHEALELAVEAAAKSPCCKSKRGVVIFNREFGIVASGFNHQPSPFDCTNDERCKEHCNKLCIHAEMDAIDKLIEYRASVRRAYMAYVPFELLHIKAVDGKAVDSGPPSC